MRAAVSSLVRFLLALGLATAWAAPVSAQGVTADISTTSCAAGSSASGCAVLPVAGMGTAAVQISRTWSGTITFSGSISSGGTFNNVACTSTAAGSSPSETTTANGLFFCPVAGLTQLRVAFTSYSSGTAHIDLQAAVGGGGAGGGSSSGSVAITQGGNTAAVNASSQLSVVCANCSGTGVSALEDIAALNADPGTPAYAVRQDTLATSTSADGDYGPLKLTSVGRLWTSTVIDTALPAGTNAIGKLAANSGVDIGDVDVTSVPADPFGVNADAASATGSISAKLRFIASTGIPITGTVTVASHAVTNAGTFVVQENGAALTALQLIDDLPHTQGSTTSGQSGNLVMGAVTTSSPSYTTAQTSPLSLDTNGSLRVAGTISCSNCSGTGVSVNEDVASNNADPGTPAYGIRQDTLVSQTSADGDYGPLKLNNLGRLWTSATIDAALPTGSNVIGALSANQSVNVSQINGVTTAMGNGIVSTGTQRVTLASDSTGQVTLAAGTAAIGKLTSNAGVTIGAVEIAASQTLATVTTVGAVTSITNALPAGTNAIGKLAANSGVDIGDVDVTTVGTITPGTAATSLGKAEDAAAASADTGVAMLGVRQDTPAGSTSADGDYGHIKLDSVGRLWVNCGTGCSGGTQYAEDAAHASGDTGTLALAVRRDTAASSSGTDGDNSTLNVDANGRMWTNIFGVTQAAATYLTVRLSDGSNFLTPGNDYTFDAALTPSTTAGPMMMGRGSSSAPTAASANDDAVMLWTDLNGRPQVNVSQINGVAPTMGNGASGTGVQRVTIASDSTGQVALAAGSALVGSVSPVATSTTTNTTVSCYVSSAASTNSTNCKAAAGNVYSIQAINTTATLYFLRLYNLASAPTCSSATGFVRTIPVPASATGAGVIIPETVGEGFSTGIGFCLTGGGSSTDNTNAATGVYVTLLYK